ncbi:MAG: MucR family transcriptional regulator [Magnetococcales bacterium]|nr:MucR family transcriptional regulator [Magnetococcales bacterium]
MKEMSNILAVRFPELSKEWDYSRNNGLTPHDIRCWSHRKVWWKCNHNHFWQSTVAHRSSGKNCPYCSGHRACKDNCLQTKNPKIAKEWHPRKNHPLKPSEVTPGSNRKVWWRCSKGHEWEAKIANRHYGRQCPYCSGKRFTVEHSLAHKKPKLAAQWDYERNGDLTPYDVRYTSRVFVWWICEKGHRWKKSLHARSGNKGCPYCSGKLFSKDRSIAVRLPHLVKEWDFERNGAMTPHNTSYGSGVKVWWKCANNHRWSTPPQSRNRGNNCPYCSGRKASRERSLGLLRPELVPEWHPTRNRDVTPFSVTCGSNKTAYWICMNGHEWCAKIISRAKGHGCRKCHIAKMIQQRKNKINVEKHPDRDRADVEIIPTLPTEDEILTCLICGEEFRSLLWHIKVSHAMTPDLYRERFSLPNDFPMAILSVERSSHARITI